MRTRLPAILSHFVVMWLRDSGNDTEVTASGTLRTESLASPSLLQELLGLVERQDNHSPSASLIKPSNMASSFLLFFLGISRVVATGKLREKWAGFLALQESLRGEQGRGVSKPVQEQCQIQGEEKGQGKESEMEI